jgi:hypothetical protein
VLCSNCNGVSHDFDHCFADGGGMAGQGLGKKKKDSKDSKNPSKSEKDSASAAAELDSGEISCALTDSVPKPANNVDSEDDTANAATD